MDVPFHLAPTPWQGQGCFHCIPIPDQVAGEAGQRRCLRSLEPWRECCEIALPDEPEELPGKLCDSKHLGLSLVDLFEIARLRHKRASLIDGWVFSVVLRRPAPGGNSMEAICPIRPKVLQLYCSFPASFWC